MAWQRKFGSWKSYLVWPNGCENKNGNPSWCWWLRSSPKPICQPCGKPFLRKGGGAAGRCPSWAARPKTPPEPGKKNDQHLTADILRYIFKAVSSQGCAGNLEGKSDEEVLAMARPPKSGRAPAEPDPIQVATNHPMAATKKFEHAAKVRTDVCNRLRKEFDGLKGTIERFREFDAEYNDALDAFHAAEESERKVCNGVHSNAAIATILIDLEAQPKEELPPQVGPVDALALSLLTIQPILILILEISP